MSKKSKPQLGAQLRDQSAQADGEATSETLDKVLKPAAGLVLADIVLRIGSNVMRGGVERAVLRNRYGKNAAKQIVGNVSTSRKLASIAIAKFAARSVPGAALVSTGLLVRFLYDRRKARIENEAHGTATLVEKEQD